MATLRATEQTDTRAAILDSAERLVQERGFNGFSYADVAAELSITKAALHYHFPGKAELGEALIWRYASRFDDALDDVDASGGVAFERLSAYVGLYQGVLKNDRMCLCGMLAAEYQTLPDAMRRAVFDFFERNHLWLARLLRSGKVDETISFTGRPEHAAQMIVGTLEGAMLVARPYADITRFQAVADQLLNEFRVPPPSLRRSGQR